MCSGVDDKPRWWSSKVRRSGPAAGGDRSNVNTGFQYFGEIPTARIARSAYLHQVQQIFPWELIGRDAELAELAEFCTIPDGGPYVWWQGPAWAGKSALMAWFVLHPPAAVRVVSFFITARYAGQSDRSAFLEVVLEQLAQVARQPMPDLLTESNRQGWFGRVLADAAMACERDGLRLVLLVDGLDEDQGVTGAPEAHSIAALLPAVPPAGVRVIVTGRPDPPVPADVPQWHPLRDKQIVRLLSVSPQAQMVRDDAERELGHLLHGGGLGRTLLGLVTAAGGGLSGDDLAELSGGSPWMVERVLRAVSGRTFRSRDNSWQTSRAPVFVLAHEELQQVATKSLSPDELSGFRDQLHRWADKYRQRGWPAGTPEYLLRGYQRLLHTTGDLERMIVLATDLARQDRMLDVSGGDAAALAEITTIQEFICGQDHPDLTATLNLAIARDRLAQRNSNIPTELPAVWATLGNPIRAEALARSITDPSEQARALAAVAEALAKGGDLGQAEITARAITDPSVQARALAAVAEALAKAGGLDQAHRLANQAATTARAITSPYGQARAMAAVAEALAKAGDLDQARRLAHQAATTARAVTDPSVQAWALAAVAQALAKGGDLGQAETTARAITDPSEQARALAAVAEALAKAGDLDQARRLAHQAATTARAVTGPSGQARALAAVAEALAKAGDLDQARQLTDQAATTARAITDPSGQAWALAAVAQGLAKAGDLGQAATTARAITSPSGQARALAAVAEALAEAGDLDQARQLAGQAEITARAITNPSGQAWALAAVAEALAKAGDLDQARRLTDQAEITARAITSPSAQARALAAVAEALAKAGDLDQARRLTNQAATT